MSERAVGYYRVSTELQAKYGFSLDAQRAMVRRHCREQRWELAAEYAEAESGYRPSKHTLDKRPQLQAALKDCRRLKARLVIAALDRLARNVVFIATLVETRIEFVALDLPDASPFMIHIYAAIAEEESRQKGRTIRAALALARAQGKRWDQRTEREKAAAQARAEALRPVVDEIRATGLTGANPIARAMNRRAIPNPSGKPWEAWKVQALLERLGYYQRATVPWSTLSPVQARQRAEALRPAFDAARAAGHGTNKQIAAYLNANGIETYSGRPWTRDSVASTKSRYLGRRELPNTSGSRSAR